MNQIKNLILVILLGYMAMSCKTEEVFWVRGTKTPCDIGAGKSQCLNVYKGASLDDATWTLFAAPIEGFNFEEGTAQKIKVTREELKKGEVPADGSSYKYKLDKVIETKQDNSTLINGNWVVVSIFDNPINRMAKLPNLNVDVENNTISGFDGCNNYSANITKLTSVYFNFSTVRATQKMCVDMTVPNDFNKALSQTYGYNIKDNVLALYNDSKKIVMTLQPFVEDNSKVDDRINNSWEAVRIFGNPINRMAKVPTILVDTSKKFFIGNDGCNTFSASIVKATSSTLQLSNVASSEKACPDMDTASKFDNALLKTASYTIDGKNLILYDAGGQEILAFIPQLKKDN